MHRLGMLLGVAVCLVLALEQPAAAHGSGGVVATNFESSVDGIAPALPGVRVRLIEAGDRLELRNDGPEVVVLGEDTEPYLRIGPDGAFENRLSPTRELNRLREHDPKAAGGGDPNAPPDWRKLSDGPLVRWHDHRIHWSAARNPPEVERRPGERHVVYPRWEIQLQRGPARAVVFGKLTWVPAPSPAPWFGLIAGVFVGIGGLGLLRRWGPPLAAATAVVLVVDVAHAVSVAFAFTGGVDTHLAKLVTGSFYAVVGWSLAAVAVRLLRGGKVDGLYAGVFAGLSMALFGGLLDLATLYRSFSSSTLPLGVARLFVALSAGGGIGLAAACLLVIQRTPDARRVVGANAGSQDEADPRDVDGGARNAEVGAVGMGRPDRDS